MKSNKIVGILLLLIYVCVATALLNDAFIKPYNLQNLLRSSSMFAIIGIGAVMVIVTGGIDLSTGSLIGLVGCTMTLTLQSLTKHPPEDNGAWLLSCLGWEALALAAIWIAVDFWRRSRGGPRLRWQGKGVLIAGGVLLIAAAVFFRLWEVGPWVTVAVAVIVALLLSLHLGVLHGLLITQLKLQPFVVTLCGLMCYRGLSRWLTSDQTQGLGTEYNDSLRLLAIGKPCTATLVLLVASLGLIGLGLVKLLRHRGPSAATGRFWGGLITGFGVILAVISSSRYWDGWEVVTSGDVMCSFAGWEFRFFRLELTPEAVDRPAYLMGFALYPLLIGMVALLLLQVRTMLSRSDSGPRSGLWRPLLPFALVLAGLVGLFYMVRWIDGAAVTLTSLESTTVWGVSTTYGKMAGVFLAMAALMGGVTWMGRAWIPQLGLVGKALWLANGFFAVLWLLSQTAIHETVVQTPFFILVALGAVAAIFLNKTIWGRYLLAMGNNEDAARFSGIDTDRMKLLAYVLCAFCGGIGAVLFTLDSNNVEPSGHGSFYELYAIAAAVLGGCSLRGGEGSILGVVIGASIMRVLYNAPDMIGIASQLELFTIGIVILIGVMVDESARRLAAQRDRKIA